MAIPFDEFYWPLEFSSVLILINIFLKRASWRAMSFRHIWNKFKISEEKNLMNCLNNFMFIGGFVSEFIIDVDKCLWNKPRTLKWITADCFHTRSTSGNLSIFCWSPSAMSCASLTSIISGKTIWTSTRKEVPKWNARTVSIFSMRGEWWKVNHWIDK